MQVQGLAVYADVLDAPYVPSSLWEETRGSKSAHGLRSGSIRSHRFRPHHIRVVEFYLAGVLVSWLCPGKLWLPNA